MPALLLIALKARPVSRILQTNRQTDERAIGDCVLAKICWYNANCIGDNDNWHIVENIDVWLVWKSIGLHVLAYDANALYPSLPIRLVLWPGDIVIGPLSLHINRVLYSAKMHAFVHEILRSYFTAFMGKMRQFYLNMNIEGQLWRHAVASSVTLSTSKVLFLAQFLTIFPYLMSKLVYLKYFEIFKMAAILRSGRAF